MAEEIRNISLSHKKSFSIDGDINRIIQIDTSDLNVTVRLEEVYTDLLKLAIDATDRMASVKDNKEEEDDDAELKSPLSDYSEILKDIDKQMREKVDYIFDSPVSDICVPSGNMYSIVGGEFNFERVVDALITLYANDIASEFKKMQSRVKKHTDKYTNRRKKKQ